MPSIQKSHKKSHSFTSRIVRKCSVIVAHYLNAIGVTPMQVLFFRVIFFGGGSLYFLFQSDYWSNMIGLFLIFLCTFFDYVDGDLARNHDQVTEVGGFLDGNFDAIVLNSVIATLTLRFYLGGYDELFVIAGIAILFGTIFSSKVTEIFRNRFRTGCGRGNEILEVYREEHHLDNISELLYRFITPKGLPYSLLSNFREYFLVGIIFGIMPYTFIGFAIAINLRWMILFTTIAFYYSGRERSKRSLKLFELLKESDTRDSW